MGPKMMILAGSCQLISFIIEDSWSFIIQDSWSLECLGVGLSAIANAVEFIATLAMEVHVWFSNVQ